MQLYTREDLLKRAWVADARQADMMIDAIAASYNGDINTFDCLINGVANLHWMSESLKCTDPSSTVTETVQSTEEVSQVTLLKLDEYEDFIQYDVTINQYIDGVLQSEPFSYATSPGDDINTVASYFITAISSNTNISISAEIGEDPNDVLITAGSGYPIFTTTLTQYISTDVLVDGEYIEKIEATETPIGRCLTDENISGIVLKIERMVGSLCGCDPNELIDDTLPDVVKYTNPNIYPIEGGPLQVVSIGGTIPPPIIPEPEVVDFNIQDFNPQDFN